jgi:transposase
LLQVDVFSGYNRLYAPEHKPGHIVEARCCSDAKPKFFELADIAASARRGKNAPPISPIALETVARIDAVFSVECDINGASAAELLRVQRQASAPLFAALGIWLRAEHAKLSRHVAIAKAID